VNTYFAENAKKLDEIVQIPSEGVKSIDVYALYGFVESFSPISTAEQIKQRVGDGLGYKDLFGTKSVHYSLEPKDFSHFFSGFNRIKSTLNPYDQFDSVYLILMKELLWVTGIIRFSAMKMENFRRKRINDMDNRWHKGFKGNI